MKFYAIGYEQIDGIFTFYGYTCKFFSERVAIDKGFYKEIKKSFPMAGRNNKTISGMYYPEGL